MDENIVFKKIIALLKVFVKRKIKVYTHIKGTREENNRYIGLGFDGDLPLFMFTKTLPNDQTDFFTDFSEEVIDAFELFLMSISLNPLIIEDHIDYTHQLYKENETKIVNNIYSDNFYEYFQAYRKKDVFIFEKRFLSFLIRFYKKHYNMC